MTTSRGVDRIARRDRVHYSGCTDRVDSLSWVSQVGLRAHEDGIIAGSGSNGYNNFPMGYRPPLGCYCK